MYACCADPLSCGGGGGGGNETGETVVNGTKVVFRCNYEKIQQLGPKAP